MKEPMIEIPVRVLNNLVNPVTVMTARSAREEAIELLESNRKKLEAEAQTVAGDGQGPCNRYEPKSTKPATQAALKKFEQQMMKKAGKQP